MLEFKQSTTALFPVRLISSSSGNPSAGIVSSAVTGTAKKADGTVVTLTITGNWTEETNGAFNQSGTYYLSIPGSVLDQVGMFSYAIAVSGCDTYVGIVKVIGAENGDIAASLSSSSQTIQDILDYHQGKWEVVTSGPDVNKMVFYRVDGTTVLKKFALQKADGTASYSNPFKRIPL